MTEPNKLDEIIVAVQVFASAKKEKLIQKDRHKFEIFVKEPAQNNLANRRVAQILAEKYGVYARDVQLISGHRSPKKKFRIML